MALAALGYPPDNMEEKVGDPASAATTVDAAAPPPAPDNAQTLEDAPTESHALAVADHDLKGASQLDHDHTEVRNLGWNEEPEAPVVGGLPNPELWTLIRRFNQQTYHVKAMQTAPPGGLDLNIADEDEFSPDKLRCNVERLYMTVIVGLMGFGKHIARLRSWNERRRTAAFGTAYLVAWALDFLIPLFMITVIVLIVYPPSRSYLFPPAPLALVDNKTGGLKKPSAGVLGSHDSMTGAAETHQGEAVEQEAHNFVSGLGSLGLSAATGKHPANPPQEKAGAIDTSVPDPTSIASAASDSRNKAAGDNPDTTHDKTKKPMEEAIWTKARPVMHAISDIADGWERFANGLSPTPPFPRETARLKFAGVIVALLANGVMMSSYVFVKLITFSFGAFFFGDPVISRGIELLNRKVPNWQQYLELRNSILKGVPTNAQLTITLLRIGESNKAPLPPPPSTSGAPSDAPKELDTSEVNLDASHGEIQDAIHKDDDAASADATSDKPAKKNHGRHVVSFFKRTTRAGVNTVLGTDQIKAAAGNQHARHRKGVIPPPDLPPSGPVEFQARHDGKKGKVLLNTAATVPVLSFNPLSSSSSNPLKEKHDQDLNPLFSIVVADIREIRKVGGFGWKAKLVVGWALDREVADGMTIVEASGKETTLTAIPLRDELFNRLIAMCGQKWESW